ncbi:MAG: hypothetical protein ACXAC7_10800 [Candidatus Hodarchaeales archaeon]|jgi:transcription initiation factor TFIIE subunit alpha
MVQTDKEKSLFRKIIQSLMGDDTVQVSEYLMENPEATDEEMAEDLDINIKIIRNSLFKLNEQSLARFRRIRNSDTGYFVYHWTLDPNKMRDMLNRRNNKIIDNLKQRILFEEDNLLYHCNNPECQPMTLEQAYTTNFVCRTCGQNTDQMDNSIRVEFLEAVIDTLKDI